MAIIGMAGRFPGSPDLASFWGGLVTGREAIKPLNDEGLVAAGVDRAKVRDPSFVKARAQIDDVEMFDADFFGVIPRQAELMDPQHRLFLELTWAALEDAACDPSRCAGRIGVFAGSGFNAY